MKKSLVFFVLLSQLSLPGFAQEDFKPAGNAFATIFANFHKGITGTALDDAAFELVRGYIGYEYNFSPEFYAKINIDVGSPNDLSPYSKLRRYAYFKNAYLRYTKNQLEIEFGLISLKQFKLQEKIWERRYLMETLADEYKLGASADLGVNFHYTFSENMNADFTIMNGEGYNNIQTDDIFKYGIGSTVKYPRNFTSRIFYDFSYDELFETTLLLFSSYDYRSKWNLAGEFIFRRNDSWQENHDIFGMSLYGKYNITPEYQLFARYDRITSNIPEGDDQPWHLAKDGTAVVAGIQYTPIRNIKIALNYHDWYPWALNAEGGSFIYLDFGIQL